MIPQKKKTKVTQAKRLPAEVARNVSLAAPKKADSDSSSEGSDSDEV